MINKSILVGNVGKNPEVKHLDSGSTVASFSLATSETYKDKNGERQKQTEWHNIVFWGKTAEVVEKYITKGMLVYIEGKITTRKWQDKDGNDRYTTEIIGQKLQMLGKSTGEVSEGKQNATSNPVMTEKQKKAEELKRQLAALNDDDSELPF